MEKIILSVENLNLSFGKAKILENINFKIFAGEYIGLIGPNGAGKSSLLFCLMKHYKPTKGKIVFAENTVIGYVPQNLELQTKFSLSVEEFLKMGIRKKMNKNERKEILKQVLNDVGFDEDFLEKNFQYLSGGQQQRIIIARAIIHKPNLLLFDEPLKEIDHETKIRIYQLVAELNEKYGITIFFVSHEIYYIAEQANRILCLDKKLHQGCHSLNSQELSKYLAQAGKVPIKGESLVHHKDCHLLDSPELANHSRKTKSESIKEKSLIHHHH